MKRNAVAKDVRSQKYRMKVVGAKKGKGSWHRKEKYEKQIDEN